MPRGRRCWGVYRLVLRVLEEIDAVGDRDVAFDGVVKVLQQLVDLIVVEIIHQLEELVLKRGGMAT